MASKDIDITLIVPCYNESETLDEFFGTVIPILSSTKRSFEILCINDGSSDKTAAQLHKLSMKNDCRVKAISFSRNFGKEAAMYAGAKKVDNLIATIDCNGQQIDGTTDEVLSLGDLKAKWEAFGWTVVGCENGNDMKQMVDALTLAKTLSGKGKPVVVLMKTEMGYGVDFMQGTNKYHGVAPSNDELERALAQLNETLGDY